MTETIKQPGEKKVIQGFLDVNDKHPALWGDAILIRDDDGMGFALGLSDFRGALVRVTIEVLSDTTPQYWTEKG